ncbi:MAG: RraA family protein [Pseudomonadota bacterium]
MTSDDFTRFPTGNLCNANPAVRPVSAAIKPLIPGKRIAGRACTARITPGQNAAIHRAVHKAEPGDILVVDGAASERFGPFGDLLAECCMARGITGGIFDCTIRDSADIAALGFQVFSRGFHPEATAKTDPGETGVPVMISGVIVDPGDIVVGDDDGLVVIPAGIAIEVLSEVTEVASREEKIRARILAGETTYEIFGLERG